MDEPRMLACVLHYGDPALTERCIRSLASQSEPLRILVIDNDGGWVPPADLAVAVLRPGRNRGYAGGMNGGLRRAVAGGFAYALLVTNDVWLEQPDVVAGLHDTLERRADAAACGAALWRRTPEGGVGPWGSAGSVDRRTGRISFEIREDAAEVACDWIGGSLMLVRVSSLAGVGLFDERFFLYVEEVDWCMRATARGWSLVARTDVVVCEEASASASARPGLQEYYLTRNRLLLFAKHREWLALARGLIASLRLVAGELRRRGDWRPPAFALVDFALGRSGGRRYVST